MFYVKAFQNGALLQFSYFTFGSVCNSSMFSPYDHLKDKLMLHVITRIVSMCVRPDSACLLPFSSSFTIFYCNAPLSLSLFGGRPISQVDLGPPMLHQFICTYMTLSIFIYCLSMWNMTRIHKLEALIGIPYSSAWARYHLLCVMTCRYRPPPRAPPPLPSYRRRRGV